MNNVNSVIAAKSNQVINRELKNYQKEWGDTSTIFDYKFKQGGPSFNIVETIVIYLFHDVHK